MKSRNLMRIGSFLAIAFLQVLDSSAFHPASLPQRNHRYMRPLLTTVDGLSETDESSCLQTTIFRRKSCKRYRRFDGKDGNQTQASIPDPRIVEQVLQCLDLSRRTPSAFNTQPYKICLVQSVDQKNALSKYCLGPNQARVRDSDCTVAFLADRQVMKTFRKYRQMLETNYGKQNRKSLFQTQFYISMFSSGYPLPRFLSSPLSFFIRTLFSFVDIFTRRFYPMPSLANAETWTSKQTLMVAMTFLLTCTSLNLATTPMEGFNAGGIRKVLRVPGRYSVPLIVAVGTPFAKDETKHVVSTTDRYPFEDVVYDGIFGTAFAT